jgi:hypothetical protein
MSTNNLSLRRSARIAGSPNILGSVFLEKPQKYNKNKPKAQLRPRPAPIGENPIKFYMDGWKLIFDEMDGWADQNVVWEPLKAEKYIRVVVDIEFDNHEGSCQYPKWWISKPHKVELYFKRRELASDFPFMSLYKSWSEVYTGHEKTCDAGILYTVLSVDLNWTFKT